MSNNTVSKFLLGTCLAVFVSTSFSVPVNTQSNILRKNQRNRSETGNILKNIKDKDPLKAQSQRLTKNNQNENEPISKQSELGVKFSLSEKKVKVSGKNGNLNISIPNTSSFDAVDTVDNKVIYSGKNAKTDLILESVEGGIRQIINIKDSSAPDYYDFKMDMDKGDEIVINKDGSAVVLTNDPESQLKGAKIPEDAANKELLEILKKGKKVKFSIGKPWAKDANGKELETKYTVQDKNTLRQQINLKGSDFPVVADPIWCGNAISTVTWISRSGLWSASVKPTVCRS